MVMCILSAVAAGGGIITVGVSAVLFKFCDDYYDRDYDWVSFPPIANSLSIISILDDFTTHK